MQTLQSIVIVSTVIIFILSFLLSLYITKRYLSNKQRSHLMWSVGLWIFSISVILELFFALGNYSTFLMAAYLLFVVLIVEFLALGSIQLVKTPNIRKGFYVFCILAAIFTIYSLAISPINNLVITYVVAGNPPLLVIIASSIATFVSSVVIIGVAAKGYLKSKNKKLLSIITGVIVVAVAGTLYIASFPALLYYSEFFGVLLLWIGFV